MRSRAAIESILSAGIELTSALEAWEETLRKSEVDKHMGVLGLAKGGIDPAFQGQDAVWLQGQPGLERLHAALLQSMDPGFEGVPKGEPPFWPRYVMEASGLLAIAHRTALRGGDHERFFRGLEATHALGRLILQVDGTLLSMTGFYLMRPRWIGDELGSESRTSPWTRADAQRLDGMLEAALASLTAEMRPLRYVFWETVELELEGNVGDESEGAMLTLASEFASREERALEAIAPYLEQSLAESGAAALAAGEEMTHSVYDYWHWSALGSYLTALADARSEIETLRLALAVSLTGKDATAESSRGHLIHAKVEGDFVGAQEANLEEFEAWSVRVPLVK